jgi:hypothetical protein
MIAQLRRKYGIKRLRQLYRETVSRVLKLTDGDRILTAGLLSIGKTSVYRLARTPGRPTVVRRPSRSKAEIAHAVQQFRGQFGFKTERELLDDEISRVLKLTGGNRQLTAQLLGIGMRATYRHVPVSRQHTASQQ